MESKRFVSCLRWIFQEPFGGRTLCVKRNPKARSLRGFVDEALTGHVYCSHHWVWMIGVGWHRAPTKQAPHQVSHHLLDSVPTWMSFSICVVLEYITKTPDFTRCILLQAVVPISAKKVAVRRLQDMTSPWQCPGIKLLRSSFEG